MQVELVEIAAVPDSPSARWKVRALSINGVSPALTALDAWGAREKSDFKKIIKSLRFAAQMHRVPNENYVKKCANPKYGDVYEARAPKGLARLMFFYCNSEECVIVCTNEFWKSHHGQDQAFAECAKFKALFEEHYR
jgi:hypothetical protein